ncbi:MAG: ATP-binding domain-containing protein, partial [Kiritimatiellaeota bacterium]|nr:ATP-binding domain-containing protein [Kiritimatiellota bacterium]
PAHARLTQSHRFDPTQGIGLLKNAIQKNDPAAAWQALQSATGVLSCQPPSTDKRQLPARLKKFLASPDLETFRGYPASSTLREAFARFDTFRVLCATHDGPSGVDAFNAAFREILNIPRLGRGDPLMVTQNDPANNVYNGDTGLCWDDGSVHFPDPEKPGEFRSFSQHRLSGLVPAFAITVHKSQGSDFDNVLVSLPEKHTPLLTRELLYTAVTRARSRCALWASRDAIFAAAQNPSSGGGVG